LASGSEEIEDLPKTDLLSCHTSPIRESICRPKIRGGTIRKSDQKSKKHKLNISS
jgi:hypothetical protein